MVTGIGGEGWLDAADAAVGTELGHRRSPAGLDRPGPALRRPRTATWAELREISDGGVLLVRPDLYVAARQLAAPESAQQAYGWLAEALAAVLHREI